MTSLNKKALLGLLQLLVAMGAMLFLPAWTLNYWQAWFFLAVFFTSTLAITLYLMKNDPKLLERRVQAGPGSEKEKYQKIIQSLASLAFVVVIAFPAVDHRLGWSLMPTAIAIAGDALVALGLFAVFLVFKENTFTSGTIEVASDQIVISTGPYAIVRHPMYSGAFVMLIGVPLALGSWWGLLTVVPMIVVIVARLLDEEKFLVKNLEGYAEYRGKVRWRLVPFVW